MSSGKKRNLPQVAGPSQPPPLPAPAANHNHHELSSHFPQVTTPHTSEFPVAFAPDFVRPAEVLASLRVAVAKLEGEVERLRNQCEDLHTFKHRVGELEKKNEDLTKTVDKHKMLVARVGGAIAILLVVAEIVKLVLSK